MKTAIGAAALAALGLVTIGSSSEGSQLFLSDRVSEAQMTYMRYVTDFGKSYGTKQEFEFRFKQFKNTMAKIDAINSDSGHGSAFGLNHFSDWTEEELKKILGTRPLNQIDGPRNEVVLDTDDIPDSIDWRTKNAVTPVRNCGGCHSDWAFASVQAIEGSMVIGNKSDTLDTYSVSQILDCQDDGNYGCNGGFMNSVFKYAKTNPLMLEDDYPYYPRKGDCQYDKSKGKGTVTEYTDVPRDATGAQLKAALVKAPVAVGVAGSNAPFMNYKSGIITKGCPNRVEIGVLAVGYGTENGTDYFLIKNSWTTNWGDKGYAKIAPDQCGITTMASYPTS